MPPSHACKCLNVRISTVPPPSGATSDLDSDTQYDTLYALNDGISIAHSQLTIRDKGKALQPSDSLNLVRITTVSCLVCHLAVYRVREIVASEDDSKEGPAFPTDKWAEETPLLSSSGWIQVNTQSLTGKSISEAESLPGYSQIFNIVIPNTTDISISPLFENTSMSRPEPQQPLFPEHPLFPPPPFSPKHVVYQHLVAAAQQQSTALRAEAETLMREKLREVSIAEKALQKQTEILWLTFRNHLGSIERDAKGIAAPPRSPATVPGGKASPGTYGTPLAVHDFVPEPVSRSKSPTGHRHMSSLSASLATSSFHHPRAQEQSTNAGPRPEALSSTSPQPISNGALVKPGPSSVLNFRRSEYDEREVAASYQVRVLEDEERAKYLQERAKLAEEAAKQKPKPTARTTSQTPLNQSQDTGAKQDPSLNSSPGSPAKSSPSKGKRTVTFDIAARPEEAREEAVQTNGHSEQEMVFDLEDEDGQFVETRSKPSEPLDEMPSSTRAFRRSVRQNHTQDGLPQSYSALRPASLPAPSVLRAGPPAPIWPERPASSKKNEPPPEPEDYNEQERELLNLVGANVPSHRGLYRKGGKAWQHLIEGKHAPNSNGMPDEPSSPDALDLNEGPTFHVGSMPIPVRSFGKQDARSEPSAVSYQPGSFLPSYSLPSGKTPTSRSIRRALYAERDRARGIDPGHLDFVVEELGDDEEDELPELSADQKDEKGDRSKQAALRILQKRAEIPHEGMWRSLAD